MVLPCCKSSFYQYIISLVRDKFFSYLQIVDVEIFEKTSLQKSLVRIALNYLTYLFRIITINIS